MAQLTVGQAFDLALQQHKAGRLGQAEQIYRQILAQQPGHVGTLNMLGVLAHQVGRHDVAIELFRKALAVKPDYAEAQCNLGMVLVAKGQLGPALAAFRQAVALKPDLVEAWNNLGNALKADGKLEEAFAAFRRAIKLKPDYADAHGDLGYALQAAGRVDEAIAAFQQAIALMPDLPDGHNALGNALSQQGRLDEAITAYQRAIALNANYAEAYSNVGNALREKGQADDAIKACQRAIALKPDLPEAHNNLGNALDEQGRLDEAVAAYQQVIALKPGYADAYSNLGNVLTQQGRLDEAIAAARKSIALMASLPSAQTPSRAASVHSALVGRIQYHAGYDASRLLEEDRQWAEKFEAPLAREIKLHANDRDPERRLKIGYVSADFRAHAVACSLLPLLPNHNPRNVQVFCYANVKREDAVTARFKQFDVVWRDCLRLSDVRLAEMIRGDGIDILVDLALHTAENRLLAFARKPAPVQVTWCGYPGTTGMSTIDYRFTDRFLDPVGLTDQYYTEQSIRLPHSFWCYQPIVEDTPAVNDLPALDNGYMTFGCFNNFPKVTPEALRLWMRVLGTVPNSRLIVLAHPGSHRDAMMALFQGSGIDRQRLEFVSRAPPADYFRFYHRVDLCLDPIPYPGHTSCLDALWMGVPSVTLSGNTAASRGGVSILSNVGLTEFIAGGSDEYVAIASRVAGELAPLRELRRSLRGRLQASPLMDGRQFAADIEAAYRQMWRAWCAKSLP